MPAIQAAHCYGMPGMPECINRFKKDKSRGRKKPKKTSKQTKINPPKPKENLPSKQPTDSNTPQKRTQKIQNVSEDWVRKILIVCFISYTFFTHKGVFLSGIRLQMTYGETLAIIHYIFYYMKHIYYNEQMIVNKILKHKDDHRRKEGEVIFKHLE